MKKIKLQIKNRWTGVVLFEYEKERNTIKDTVIGAVKSGVYLTGAYLTDAKEIPFIPMACPSHGAFEGWKKVCKGNVDFLVHLLIPSDARRSSATSTKCRCDKAQVLDITNLKTSESYQEIYNTNHAGLNYRVNEIVVPDSFDEVRWNECSNGIHFFINKQEAINY